MAPLVSQCIVEGLAKPRAYDQLRCYESAIAWLRTEGSIPAPETSHAIACVIDEAKKAKDEGKEKVILFNYSGHGLLDLGGYEKFISGKLTRSTMADSEICESLNAIKDLPKAVQKKSGKW
jgi:tryptophan synthase beta chain